MIFSVTQQREELLALDERRRRIAAEAARPAVPAVTALMSGAAMLTPGPAVAVKAAGPDVSKRRKGGKRGKDRTPAETASVAEAEGYKHEMAIQAAADARETAAKAMRDVATEGPGQGMMPSAPRAADAFSRPYLDGIAAASPQHEGPWTNPLPDLIPGLVTPVTLPAAPAARNVSQHVAGRYAGGSPSEKQERT